MHIGRALWRIFLAVVHVVQGALICAFVFPFLAQPKRMGHVGWWCARMLRVLGITLCSRGAPHEGVALLVANHISWLDILAINAVQPARFVSKADVRRWPLVGWLVACGGTLFIERERKRDALRVVHQVAQALQGGDTVALFPEGTTSDGHGVLPFHANLLQAAVSTGTAVQPLALRFSDSRQPVSAAAAYVGDTHLLRSLWSIVTTSRLQVDLIWLPHLAAEPYDRRMLAEALRGRIIDALSVTKLCAGAP